MGKSLRELNIFISCASDTNKRRDAIYDLCAARENHYERSKSIRIKVSSFKDVPTGLSMDGGQARIDEFFKDSFDIYIGLMGTRFGRETEQFGSGTEQEYYQALDKTFTTNAPKEVLFGFSREKMDPYTIDLEQFSKVTSFKKSLEEHQIYFEWQSAKDFEAKVWNEIEAAIEKIVTNANWAVSGGIKYSG